MRRSRFIWYSIFDPELSAEVPRLSSMPRRYSVSASSSVSSALPTAASFLLERNRHRPRAESLCKFVGYGHGVGKLHLVLVHDGGDGRLDERGAQTRQYRGDAPQNLVIEDGTLREVGDLSGTADVGRRRQQACPERPAAAGRWGSAARASLRGWQAGRLSCRYVRPHATALRPVVRRATRSPVSSSTRKRRDAPSGYHHLCVVALAD